MIAAGMVVLASCSWSNPGQHPMHGATDAAVDHYTDIPAAARLELKDKVARIKPDDIVYIYKDVSVGRGGAYTYGPPRDMHFGVKSVCKQVTMDRWADGHYEIALVYCSGPHCILVPRVCKNVSRVDRVLTSSVPVKPAVHAARLTPGGQAFLNELGRTDKSAVRYLPVIEQERAAQSVHAVPEPASWLLTLTALVGVGLSRLTKREQS